MRRKSKVALSVLFLVAIAMPAAAQSADTAALPVNVRGGVHADFNRLVFDFTQAPKYTVTTRGGDTTITFEQPVDLKFDRTATRLSRIPSVSADGKTVRLQTANNAKVSHFISGKSVVIDVRGAATVAGAPDATTVKETPPPVVEKPVAQKPAEKTSEKPGNTPAAAPVTPVTPAPENKTDATPEPSAEAAPLPAVIPAVIPANVASPVAPAIEGLGTTPQLFTQFDPKISVPAVVYARGDYLYVAFDRRLRFGLNELFDANAPGKAEAVPIGGFSAYRVPLAANGRPLVSKAGTRWQVDMVAVGDSEPAESMATQGLRARLEPEFSLGARVVIPLRGAGQILSLSDPVVGDALYLIPATNVEDHVAQRRRFADFELLPTFQGVAVRVLNDGLQVRLVEEGVEISAPQGLRLAPSNLPVEAQLTTPRQPREDVIPLRRWQQPELGTYTEGRQVLQHRVVEAIPALRDRARLDLVRYYIAYGFGVEAEGLLSIIAANNPDIVGRPEFQILRGVAGVQAHHPAEGLRALEDSKLSDRDDVRLWRAVAFAEQRAFGDAAADFGATLLLLETYPQPFFQRFSLLAAESFIAVEDDTNAERVLEVMAKRLGVGSLNTPAAQYLQGVVQARSGSLAKARDLWTKASKSSDYLSRARSELALVDLDVAAEKITVADAVRRLEGLRFSWRGDALELEMLSRLAEYQLKLKKPLDALETYERAKTIFPGSPREAEIAQQQRAIFRDVFLGAYQGQFSPLQMLAIHDRFKAYAPTDAAEAQKITDRVVDEMLAIDLLPQAITLLKDRMANATDAGAKNVLGLRLAAVHLLNREPAAAQTILQGLDVEALTPEQAQERKLMQARAHSDQNQFEPAFELLSGDGSGDAQRLLASVAWRAKDWPRAAAALGSVVQVPGDEGLTAEEAQLVLARAVALTLASDRDGLSRLNADYSAAMGKTPQAQTFALLTRSDLTAGAASLASIREQVSTVDLFQGFLENYRKRAAN